MCGKMRGWAGALGGGGCRWGRASAAMEGDDQSAEGDDRPCPEHEHPLDQLGAKIGHLGVELRGPLLDLRVDFRHPLLELGIEPGEVELVELPELSAVSHVHLVKPVNELVGDLIPAG